MIEERCSRLNYRLRLIGCTGRCERETQAAYIFGGGRNVDVERLETAVDVCSQWLRLEEEEVADVCEQVDEGVGVWDAVPAVWERFL